MVKRETKRDGVGPRRRKKEEIVRVTGNRRTKLRDLDEKILSIPLFHSWYRLIPLSTAT